MKQFIPYMLLAFWGSFLTFYLVSCSQAKEETPTPIDFTTLAKNFVELLAKEDYSNAIEMFDVTMKQAMPEAALHKTWQAIISQVGTFENQFSIRTEKIEEYNIIFVTCKFEKTMLDIKIVFNSIGEIAGLFFLPSQQFEYKPPPYAKSDSFQEKEITLGNGEWALSGTLTIPNGDGTFPVVILVHGSGPQDRDETIGPNKPFRDIAWGLASQGIATLRYEKRTKEHSQKMVSIKDDLTVKEETIDDVLIAVSMLRETEGIDENKIFVLGHSLGGMLIPRIGILDNIRLDSVSPIAGFIIMAGATRPLEDITLEQIMYIYSLDDTNPEEKEIQLEELKKQIIKVKDPELSLDTPAKDLLFGISPKYWLDLRGYEPAETIKEVKQPILILQGERDYQVTMVDFQNWKDALSDRENVIFKSYLKLNHIFNTGEGQCTPSEYLVAGYVEKSVIDDIANWIKK